MYEGNHVLAKMKELLGQQNANEWFGTRATQLDKGHLAAKADFAYVSQQNATFYYHNASPQFHALNSINWLRLEKSVRFMAATTGTVDIYTGIKDVLTLQNEQLNFVDVFLDEENQLPVPQYFWKMVHIPALNQKFAFIGINNPINADFTNTEEYYERNFCLEKCSDGIFWWLREELNDKSRNPLEGIILCCAYNDDFTRKTGIIWPTIEIELA